MYECETCTRQFGSDGARAQHMNALSHWAPFECEVCEAEFSDEDEYDQHVEDYGHWPPEHECEACDLKFHTPQLARVHMNEYGHWRTHWCSVCERGFQEENNLQVHNRSAAHLAHYTHPCEGCNLSFTTSAGVRKHMDDVNHWRTHWCQPCQRGFQNDNNLQQHLHGSAHLKDSISCPFCKKGFTVASGVAHHLETGSCPRAQNLNRETIYKAINARDTSGVVTNKLLTWDGAANAEYAATAATWNGNAYECYFCHRDFTTLRGRNQHPSSPIHKQKLYRCFGPSCGKQFPALAQLFHHLESESCGALRFETVQRGAAEIMTGNRRIGF